MFGDVRTLPLARLWTLGHKRNMFQTPSRRAPGPSYTHNPQRPPFPRLLAPGLWVSSRKPPASFPPSSWCFWHPCWSSTWPCELKTQPPGRYGEGMLPHIDYSHVWCHVGVCVCACVSVVFCFFEGCFRGNAMGANGSYPCWVFPLGFGQCGIDSVWGRPKSTCPFLHGVSEEATRESTRFKGAMCILLPNQAVKADKP